MGNIGQLVVKISADAKELSRALEEIGAGGNKIATGIERAGKMMGLALLAATSAAVANTVAIAKQTEETQQLSQKTGIAIQTLQSWSVIMAENNFQGQQLAVATQKLSKEMLAAQDPASAAAAAFDSLGVSLSDLGSTEDTLKALADHFQVMPDGAEKAAIAVQLFGKSGLDLIPILNKGAAAFEESRMAAQRFGLVLSNEQVAALTSMDDAVDQLGQALKGLQTAFAVAFAPWIEKAIKELINSIASLTLNIKDLFGTVERRKGTQTLLGETIVEETQKAVKAYEADRAEAEEKLGLMMRNRFIAEFRNIEAKKRAEEALGKTLLQIEQRRQAEAARFPGAQVPGAEDIKGAVIVDQARVAQQAILEIERQQVREELKRNELFDQFLTTTAEQVEQERLGAQIVQQSVEDYKHRFSELEQEKDLREAIADQQAIFYRMDSEFSDKAFVARRVAIDAQMAREELATAQLADQLRTREINEAEHQERLRILQLRGETERLRIAEEFPTFWEKQLKQLEQSSSFSMALIVNTWTSSIATMIVKGGDLKAAWEATQIALVQFALNSAVAMAASAAKTLVMNEATAAGVSAIWSGVGAFITGLWATVTASISAMFSTLIGIMTAVGEAIMGVLTAIAETLIDTVFGSAWGGAILAGVVAIGVALGALKAVGVFAEGGIVTGPMLGLVGEAGPEAIIPLDRMDKMFGGGQPIHVRIDIDGKKVAMATARHTASAWRAQGAGA